MAAPLDRLRDRWEHLAPRERTLIMALAGTAVVCVALFVAFLIRDGLSSIEERNEQRRDVLSSLQEYRIAEAEVADDSGSDIEIPEEALELETYLQRIANQTDVRIPGYSSQRPESEGRFRRVSTEIELEEVSLYELVDFLEKVETESELVVIRSMSIEQNFRDNEMIDVGMVVSTFERAQAPDDGEAEDGS